MQKQHIKINNIPAVIWGNKTNKIYIAIHGFMSDKEDQVIQLLAEEVIRHDYSVISFDLPEHGERKEITSYVCNLQNCIDDLNSIRQYIGNNYNNISLFACSMGAYFALQAYKNDPLQNCLFLSPVVNMLAIIENMMQSFNITEKELQEQKEIKLPIGQTLYWDYYQYTKTHPIIRWNTPTSILYGSADNICNYDIINKFTTDFHCKITIMENCEHFFHTDRQLSFFSKWLQDNIII